MRVNQRESARGKETRHVTRLSRSRGVHGPGTRDDERWFCLGLGQTWRSHLNWYHDQPKDLQPQPQLWMTVRPQHHTDKHPLAAATWATSTIETSPRHFSTFSAFSARQHKTETVSASRSVQCRRSVLGLTTTLVLLISTSPSHFLFLPATPRRSSEGALATLGARHDCHISVHLICSIIVVVSPSLLLFASYTDNHNTT